MTTTTNASETSIIAWKEIPRERRIRIREYLRRLAAELRAGKAASRQLQSAHDRKVELPNAAELAKAQARLQSAYALFRHLHAVCSLSRGKTLEQIEGAKRKSTTSALSPTYLEFAVAILRGETKAYVILHPALTNGQRLAQTSHAIHAFADLKTPWMNDTVIVKVATEPRQTRFGARSDDEIFQYWRRIADVCEQAEFIDSDLPANLQPAAFVFWGPAWQKFHILPLAN